MHSSSAPDNPVQVGGPADMLITNGRIATMNKRQPSASALAVKDGRIIGVGSESDLQHLLAPTTVTIDAGGRTVIPGLMDTHTHFVRGGMAYTLEVHWDGLPSLSDGLRMLREQAQRTPAPHWVQVIGGWTWAQFAEKRSPTLDEINAATGDTPAMVMHLFDRMWINRAGLRVLGWEAATPDPFGGRIERDASGHPTGLLVGGTAGLVALLATWGKIPRLSFEDQVLSLRHFMREHNRLGITSVIDAGGVTPNYPTDYYASVEQLAAARELTVRIGYTLFAQNPGKELENYRKWTGSMKVGQGDDYLRLMGAGEYLVFSAGDVTNFAKEPLVMSPDMENQLGAVVRHLAGEKWPFRIHASFDHTAQRILAALEQVNREVPLAGLRWGLEHCETVQPATLERVAALGGSINIQNRLSLDGEAFLAKYGPQVAADAPPIARMRELGIPMGMGTDANRAGSYNPWIGVHWLVSGKTIGGVKLMGDHNLLDRTEALRLYTSSGAWISGEEDKKGTLEVGKFADLAILSSDYFNIPEDEIKDIESMMTMVGGRIVHGAGPYAGMAPPALPINQDWLPIKAYGGVE